MYYMYMCIISCIFLVCNIGGTLNFTLTVITVKNVKKCVLNLCLFLINWFKEVNSICVVYVDYVNV
jgi:hypothetical protein